MVMMKGGGRQKKGGGGEGGTGKKKISHTCKSGQYKQDPQKGTLPVSHAASSLPQHLQCWGHTDQARGSGHLQ